MIDRMGFAKEYGCGRCLNCRINRAEEWSTRIMLELEDKTKLGDFVTLTFDAKKSCPLLSQALSKRVLQNYFKRLRKAGNRVKYFACGEYGEKHQRAHYHMIVIRPKEQEPNYQKHWNMGNVVVGNVTTASARYVTGYLTKSNTIPRGREKWPPFQLQSQGMGKAWATNPFNEVKNLKWAPRYIKEKGRYFPGSTKIPSRHFTPLENLKQRHRNALAQRNSQEKSHG